MANPPRTAIIGAGITGITLANALYARNLPFTVYERTATLKVIGAGIGFSPNSEEAMKLVDPEFHRAYRAVATPNIDDFFKFLDGLDEGIDVDKRELIHKLHMGEDGFLGCRRSDFLEGVIGRVREHVQFGRELVAIYDGDDSEPVKLFFRDGTVEEADIVIGADGIRSKVRHQLFPTAVESYTNKLCYRSLINMETAKEKIPAIATNRYMHIGPNAHVMSYPVGKGDQMNLLVVLHDPNPWNLERYPRMTSPGNKKEVQEALKDWGEAARILGDLLPDGPIDRWAIFDLAENCPAEFHKGRVALAGDAAHAAGPHLGAAGGMGVEDALYLAELIKTAHELDYPSRSLASRLRLGLSIYSYVRRPRTTRVIHDTRVTVDLFHLDHRGESPAVREVSNQHFAEKMTSFLFRIWFFDLPTDLARARKSLEALVDVGRLVVPTIAKP